MSVRSRVIALFGGALIVAAALTGCAGGAAGPFPPAPTATEEAPVEAAAAWLDGGGMIGLLLPGSSSCIPYADDVAYADGVLSVSVSEPDGACTRDLVLRGVPVPVPAGADTAADLRIAVSGPGYTAETDLPGVAGLVPGTGLEGGEPSAGWAASDAFVLLTWGSSSCPPQIDEARVTAAGAVTVTLVAPAPDQICTADMAPRVTPVAVSGAEPGTAYEAVIVGADGDARIPIAGTP